MAENFQDFAQNEIVLSRSFSCQLLKWKVSVGHIVSKGSVLAIYKKITPEFSNESEIVVQPKLKSDVGGSVKRLLVAEGEHVKPGQAVILLDVCKHQTIMKDMCAECGADLRQEPGIPGHLKEPVSASVALVHNIPELRVSQKEAEILAIKDKETLLRSAKLVLLVDLDQTLIHTTTENVPPDMEDIYHFQLYGQNCWYHTKFRPGWRKFLEDMAKLYELHIFTMGSRMYAHTIARMLDPSGVLFAERIRSRDESFDMFSKYRDLRALFPCDDSMVCIIDDREDIWDCAPNLVTVKPYRFFSGTGDINAPPGFEQTFTHDSAIPLHENALDVEEKHTTDGKGINGDSENKVEAASTGNSSDVSEKSGTNGDLENDEKGDEINRNEKLSKSEEKIKESNNGDTVSEKEEATMVDVNEMQDNDAQDYPQEESGDANSQVSKKPNEDVIDGNHIEDHDDYLLYLEEILRKIHASFYEVVAWNKQAEENGNKSAARVAPDLRYIVPELQRNVLQGTNIVFTGVIPTNCRHEDSQAWKIAKQFGASVSKDLLTHKNTADRNKRTTHVVAARPGTEKACLASRLPNVQLVNPNWLWTCAERWEWVDERLFPVEGYHEYKARRNDTPTLSRRGTPKWQPENEVSRKSSEANPPDSEESLEHMTDDNLRIVLNPFLSFSSGEMEAIDKEVEDLMRSSDEEDGEDKDDGDQKDEQILGSVSSSSNSPENGTGDDIPDGGMEKKGSPDERIEGTSKGKTTSFSTIKQNRSRQNDDGGSSKRRKLDFVVDNTSGGEGDEGSEGEFSNDGVSSESNSGDEDGNDMAAMLEAALYRS